MGPRHSSAFQEVIFQSLILCIPSTLLSSPYRPLWLHLPPATCHLQAALWTTLPSIPAWERRLNSPLGEVEIKMGFPRNSPFPHSSPLLSGPSYQLPPPPGRVKLRFCNAELGKGLTIISIKNSRQAGKAFHIRILPAPAVKSRCFCCCPFGFLSCFPSSAEPAHPWLLVDQGTSASFSCLQVPAWCLTEVT